jgi:protocatechuate 3,4-dioxygenase beta subunit
MSVRWRSVLLACAVATTVLGASIACVTGPAAQAQSAPTGGSGDSSCPSSNPPNELTLSGGTPQTAQLGVGFANPLQVELANSNGCPVTTTVTGTPITFTAPTSGPSAIFAAGGSSTLTVGSDATGSASVQMLAANDIAGTYGVTASSAYGAVSFSLTNTAAGVPATITALASSTQRATVDSSYAQPLAVRVLDANGNPVAGANVTFSLGAGAAGDGGSGSAAGASFDDGTSQATAVTNSDGVATSPGLRANSTSGAFTATASVEHVEEPAHFALDNLAARLQLISPLGSRGLSAAIGTRYARRLRVAVRDAAGNPIAGAAVTFTLGSGSAPGASAGAGATFTGGTTEVTATTGQRGIATSPRLTANEQAGSWRAKADVAGAGAVVVIRLRNRPGAPASVVAGIGATQSTGTGTRFAIALAVTVSDAHGNRASNVTVTFTAPASGPGATFAGGRRTVSVMTGPAGVAVAPPLTANADAGGYIVTASVKGVRPVAFALVNTSA